MKLSELINCDSDIEILGVATDSRYVKKGDLFIATKGFNVDHYDFIDMAVENGAVAVISDRKYCGNIYNIVVDDLDKTLISVLNKFYDIKGVSLIGITGTDGKTTSSSIIKQILNLSESTAYIGTNGFELNGNVFNTSNTTPCCEDLYYYIDKTRQEKCQNLVMEVSSEALLHKRVDSLKYDIIGFTNITEDHLNIHKTLDNYINCKKHLVDLLKSDGYLIINGDDKNCQNILHKNMYKYGFNDSNDFVIFDVNDNVDSVKFKIRHETDVYNIDSPLSGLYNVYNVTLAFIVCMLKGMDFESIIKGIKKLSSINGRRENLKFGQKYKIILDYAHTYNGIVSLINSFPDKSKLVIVTGAAGGREVQKRSKIGKFLLESEAKVIFTMDDPRNEDPNKIIEDMIGDVKSDNYKIIINRKDAIKYSFDNANDDNIILVIGKGRDNYMAVGDKKIPYCDYDVIKEYFSLH